MGIKDTLSQFILNKSNSYHFYKEFYEKSKDESNIQLQTQLDDLRNEFNQYKKERIDFKERNLLLEKEFNEKLSKYDKSQEEYKLELENSFNNLNTNLQNFKNEFNQCKKDEIDFKERNLLLEKEFNEKLSKYDKSQEEYKLELENSFNNLNTNLQNFKNDFDKYKNDNDTAVKSHHNLLNNLYVDCEVKSRGTLKYTQDLCLELLEFISNICKKYNLEFWLDFGSALGAIRHEGFIPWDDDIDIGMVRKDSERFNDIIHDEIKHYNLEDIFEVSTERWVSDIRLINFTQITIKSNNTIFAGLDIFPYDFIENPPENFRDYYYSVEQYYYNKLVVDGVDKKEAIKLYYDKYNFSFEKQEFLFPSIEISWIYMSPPLFPYNKVFPLKELKFKDKHFPCPNDTGDYVGKIYGSRYKELPNFVAFHHRAKDLKLVKNHKILFEEFLIRLRNINENFEY